MKMKRVNVGRDAHRRASCRLRDKVNFDVAAARAAIIAVSRLMTVASPEVRAIEINPLIVLPAGQGAVAVDLVIE